MPRGCFQERSCCVSVPVLSFLELLLGPWLFWTQDPFVPLVCSVSWCECHTNRSVPGGHLDPCLPILAASSMPADTAARGGFANLSLPPPAQGASQGLLPPSLDKEDPREWDPEAGLSQWVPGSHVGLPNVVSARILPTRPWPTQAPSLAGAGASL